MFIAWCLLVPCSHWAVTKSTSCVFKTNVTFCAICPDGIKFSHWMSGFMWHLFLATLRIRNAQFNFTVCQVTSINTILVGYIYKFSVYYTTIFNQAVVWGIRQIFPIGHRKCEMSASLWIISECKYLDRRIPKTYLTEYALVLTHSNELSPRHVKWKIRIPTSLT